jgi:hypothetical protein
MVRVVLEICGWGLVEGEEGGPRVWLNIQTNEMRGEDDPPPEVVAELTRASNDDAGELQSTVASQGVPSVPFRRERGLHSVAKETTVDVLGQGAAKNSQASASVPFRRERGLNAINSTSGGASSPVAACAIDCCVADVADAAAGAYAAQQRSTEVSPAQ